MPNLTFYGVRGSTPCSCDSNTAYGGNTSCVVIESPGRAPLVLDLGTGLRFFGLTQPEDGSFKGTALLSHLHWDHVQGIPFFSPLLKEGATLNIYGPSQSGTSLEEAIRTFVQPPYFPIGIDSLPGKLIFHELSSSESEVIEIEGARVTSAPIPHCGETLGYRVECDGVAIAYVSDHQQPGAGATYVDPNVLNLARDVDLLIHDAQYSPEEFDARSDWGHCTVAYAVEVAAQAGARRLALFHHDPSHSDAQIKALTSQAGEWARERGIEEVFAASERLSMYFGGSERN